MSDSTATEPVTQKWYARPVLFVSDLQVALSFYVDKLGFRKKWHADDGKGTVCQVDRGECEIILCEDSKRQDKGRLFVELTLNGIDELRREILVRSVPSQKAWRGYDVIQITDPDGNELLFPLDDAPVPDCAHGQMTSSMATMATRSRRWRASVLLPFEASTSLGATRGCRPHAPARAPDPRSARSADRRSARPQSGGRSAG